MKQQTVTLSHPDVSESVTEGHYKGIKMGDHKRLEPQLMYSPFLVQCLTKPVTSAMKTLADCQLQSLTCKFHITFTKNKTAHYIFNVLHTTKHGG